MARKVACIGGGPGGLFFATLLKEYEPDTEVVVFERNRADDTFGFGVVFSDATLMKIHEADPVLLRGLESAGAHWEDIEIRLKGVRLGVSGNGMAAISRKTLLHLLQERARKAGVILRFETEAPPMADLGGYDLVVGADGANSATRQQFADSLRPSAEVASAKFIWFGTSYMFDGLTFVHKRSEHGVFAVHGYPISDEVSTFIVETDEETWRAAGLDEFAVNQPPGPSDEKSRRYLEALFADEIDGAPLLVNNSRWTNFRTRKLERWHAGNVAFLGDAAHTAHFSVGAGTKMAMEDAIALAGALHTEADLAVALRKYEAVARPSVDKIQDSARPSLAWWEHFGRYFDAFAPVQFAFHFMTRSITRGKIARRDPEFVETVDEWWRAEHGDDPLESSLELASTILPRRVVELSQHDSKCILDSGDGTRYDVLEDPPPVRSGPWGLRLTAPETEDGLPGVQDLLAQALLSEPEFVVISGGSHLTRLLLAEWARLVAQVTVGIATHSLDMDLATTLLLSGRTDFIAISKGSERIDHVS